MRLNRLAVALVLAFAFLAPAHAQFGDWSAPKNIGPPVNTVIAELGPFLSKDGLTLYFGRGSSPPAFDIWVSQRTSVDNPWETPQILGSNINTPGADNNPALSLDEHQLYFTSDRPGGFGRSDLYVSRRHNRRDPLGWEPPVNLGSNINTSSGEGHATFFEDERTGFITMYFESDRPGLGGFDIYASTLLPDGTFSPAVPVSELNTAFNDQQPSIRRDGLEIFFASDRPGDNVGILDLMTATRASTLDPWSPPVYLGSVVNSPQRDANPNLSFDATSLFFQSTANRPDATGPCLPPPGSCVFDIYVITRTREKQPEE